MAGRAESQHRDRVRSSRRGLETSERINSETALASEIAQTISAWASEATVYFMADSKGHQVDGNKATKDFSFRDKVIKKRLWQRFLYYAFVISAFPRNPKYSTTEKKKKRQRERKEKIRNNPKEYSPLH